MMMIRCYDHVLTENIWFLWSKTYGAGKWICYRCGTTTSDEQTREDMATQPIEAG